jgi:hypothetical protein
VPNETRTRYRIVVRGGVGDRFATAFGGMTVYTTGEETHIVGEIVDQAHLHGLLNHIRALNVELISATPLD